ELRIAPELPARLVRCTPELGPGGIRALRAQLRHQVVEPVARERQELDRAFPVRAGFLGAVLFEHAMEVRAAKAERADPRAPRMVRGRQPRALRSVEIERRAPGRGVR